MITLLAKNSKEWMIKVGISLADHGVSSGSNFLLNILLARWLSPSDYGAFALSFAIFLFIAGLHNALVTEPMTVLGLSEFRRHLQSYLGATFWLHLSIAFGMAVPVVIGSAFLTDHSLRSTVFWMGLTLPCTLLALFVRRLFYTRIEVGRALLASILYALTLLTGTSLVQITNLLSPGIAYVVMAVAGLITGVILYNRVVLFSGSFCQVLSAHWKYGRWLLVTGLLLGSANHFQIFFVGSFLGLDDVGALRAMLNFVLPLTQVITAAGALVVPLLARDYGDGKLLSLRRKGMVILGVLSLTAMVYEGVLAILAGTLEHLVYGGKYGQSTWLIPVLGLIGVFSALASGFSFVLRAIQRPEHYLIAGLVAAPVGLISAVGLTWLWGLGGAAASLVIYYAAGLAVALLLYQRWAPVAHLALRARAEGRR